MSLAAYLRDGVARPWAWGVCDCSLWPADWVRVTHGIDAVPDLRGAYDSAVGALRIVRRAGGLVSLYGSRAQAIGMRETLAPRAGDVGVVAAPAGAVAAIRTPAGAWAIKRQCGVLTARFPALGAWTFG